MKSQLSNEIHLLFTETRNKTDDSIFLQRSNSPHETAANTQLTQRVQDVLELRCSFRRASGEQEILEEAWAMLLSCMFELREYALHHRLCPTKAAALLATDDGRVIKQLMDELQEEWELILKMETQLETKLLLHSKCLYVGYQQTREVLSSLAQSNYNLTPSVRSLLLAWHPQIQSSANLESIFGDLSSAIKRTGRSETASLPNMMAVGVRALHHRFQSEDEAGEPIHLDSGDWEGKEVAGLKAKLWCPSSAAPCTLT